MKWAAPCDFLNRAMVNHIIKNQAMVWHGFFVLRNKSRLAIRSHEPSKIENCNLSGVEKAMPSASLSSNLEIKIRYLPTQEILRQKLQSIEHILFF